MSLTKAVLMTTESEELDYEEDDTNKPVKKQALVLEKEKDLEEGEILDTNDEDCPKKRICYFFQRGKCRLGDKCAGLHVTDSLYKLIDSPSAISSEFQNKCEGANPLENNPNLLHSMITPPAVLSVTLQKVCFTANQQANTSTLGSYEQREPALTEWDRALIEAKKLVKQFDKITNRTCPPVTITIESDDERLSDKSTKKPRRYQSPSPKILSRDDSVKTLPEQKLIDKKIDCRCANRWHDPWRRSPVHPRKSFRSSAISHSPERRNPDTLSTSKKRYCNKAENRSKSISRRSLSSSSSSPIHRSRKESSKPVQKENVSPIKVTKLKPSISKEESHDNAKKRYKTNSNRSSSSSSRASIHRTIKESLKAIQKKNTSAVGNKSDKNLKLPISDRRSREIAENWHRTVFRRSSSPSVEKKRDKHAKLSDQRSHKIAENGHKATFHRPSTSSSPPSVYRSRERVSKRQRKTQMSKQEKKISPAVLDNNSKSNERVKEKFPSSSFTSGCRSNNAGRWTPKKVKPPTPTVKSCSDMSISPYSDASLSDIFDPDKKENMDRTYRHDASRSRSFQPLEKCQAEVYGPICPPKNQIIAPSMSESKSKAIQSNKSAFGNISGTTKVVSNSLAYATKNKTVDASKSKQLKTRKFSRNLETDLLKFHREMLLENDAPQESTEKSEPVFSNDVQQKSTETKVNKTTKNVQSQKMAKILSNQAKKGTSLTQRNPRCRKEEILQQLEAINAAIARKKTIMYALRN